MITAPTHRSIDRYLMLRRMPTRSHHTSVSDRVDRIDLSLFDQIQTGGTQSSGDRNSLLALHAALAARGDFNYLEIGSYLGGSLQAFIVDPRCRSIVAIDRRDKISPDERSEAVGYPNNTTAEMLERLSAVPGANFEKLTTVDASTEELEPAELSADLCFIDAEHTNAAALRDARFCRQVIRDRGIILFHDRTLVYGGIQAFLRELSRYRAYPLAHDLLVVEIGIPSLLLDPRVKAQVPRKAWLVADRLRAMRMALRLAAMIRR
jgi:predicted O-methyltransferase YrrM